MFLSDSTVTVTLWDNVNQMGHLSKTHLNLLEMFEISFVDAAMSRALNYYQTRYMGWGHQIKGY